MSAHTHTTLVPGCYRCELGKDEMTMSDLDALRARLTKHSSNNERTRAYDDGVDAALAALEQVGWCDDPEWTDLTKTVGRLWHRSKPQMGGVPVYRIKPEGET